MTSTMSRDIGAWVASVLSSSDDRDASDHSDHDAESQYKSDQETLETSVSLHPLPLPPSPRPPTLCFPPISPLNGLPCVLCAADTPKCAMPYCLLTVTI